MATELPGAHSRARLRVEQPLGAVQFPDALLKLETVRALVGLGKTSIYDRMAEGTFPQAIRQGSRCTRWRAGDISAWLSDVRADVVPVANQKRKRSAL